jgi:glutathione synthase/RimK-type ligase-like ATP-grasp enzyme
LAAPPSCLRDLALLDGLHLPEGVRLGLTGGEGGDGRGLRLGPVVGILTVRGRRTRFGGQTPILREMTRLAGEQGVLAFAFTPSGIDWDRGTIRGHVFREWLRGWRSGQFPFPDVIYNRVPSRRAERNPLMAATSARLARLLGPRYFNPCFLDKWDTHQALARDPRLRALLPETRRYAGVGDLLDMLDRFRQVYLKPTGGSQGRGIIRVVRGGDGQYIWQHQGRSGVRLGLARGPAALRRAIDRLTRQRTYLVQEGLNLGLAGGRPFDVRVLMQRDESGVWRRTKLFARVGGRGGITANISGGGTGEPLPRVVPLALDRARPRHGRTIIHRVRDTALTITPLVEAALEMKLGELGLDLGVDRTGRIWLLEVNSRPWRTVKPERGSIARTRLALLRPLAYARYLAGFTRPAGAARAVREVLVP